MRRHLSWLLGIGLVALLAVPATWLLFTHFMVYDDEGYVLWSLKNYAELGGLYTRVYSQYGPAFYAAYDALHRLTGLAFTNENGRWITLLYWCGTAWIAGDIAARLTGKLLARLVATLLAFAALSVMCNEPIHPGGPLVFACALAAWCGVVAITELHIRWLALAGGALGAIALLTKINVGVFLLFPVGSWLFLHAPWSEKSRWHLGSLLVLASVLAPLALMRDKLDEPRYAGFALLAASSAAALALMLRRSAQTKTTHGDWAAFALAVLGVSGLVVGAVLARGTNWADLVHGVAIAPFKQTAVYALPPRMVLPSAIVSLLGLGAVTWLVSRPNLPARLISILAAMRLLVCIGVAVATPAAIDHATGRYFFYGVAAVAWLCAWPLRDADTPASRARLWLAWIFIWQTLQAFPVAGSQVAWGALLGAPLLVVGAFESLAVLFPRPTWRTHLASAALFACALAPCLSLARTGWIYRQISPRLGLPGAEHLALPANLTQAAQAICRNVRLHGGLLFSHPGMFSFNLWTGHPTPTAANVTLWSTLLSDEQQREIQARLAADPRAVIISQQYVLGILIGQGFAPRGELNRYLVENFTPAFRIDTYVFWVRQGRSIAPVGTAHLESLPDASGWAVDLVTDSKGLPVQWQLWSNGVPTLLQHGELAPAEVQIEPLRPDSTSAGTPRVLSAGALDGTLARVRFKLPRLRLPSADDLELRLLATDGSILESVPFRR